MGPELSAFFRLMNDRGLMDLKVRDGKAGGGFCTAFPRIGVPYIFANFNGTKGDVEVFTHEMGHAFQNYSSCTKPLSDYHWPTVEACEIHSMGLEYLTWPHMDKFFGEDGQRFRDLHLTSAIFFLPYGVAVDHFQHLVYAKPDATPEQRHAMWQEMEQLYLPWRDNGDLAYLAKGGRWQLQRHIYLNPFYYIDYTLAEVCALQFWLQARASEQQALKNYIALCQRGGEVSFVELVESAGMKSPFAEGVLRGLVKEIRDSLESSTAN
jgi:M3 family oligoendopeptidase